MFRPFKLKLGPVFLEIRRAVFITVVSASAAFHAWFGPARDEPVLLILAYAALFFLVDTWEKRNGYRRVLPQWQRTLISLPAFVCLVLFLYKFVTEVPMELLSSAVLQSTGILLLLTRKKA